MDIAALKAFLAVADSNSFSAAADKLFLTQPAVSKRVAALEAELGANLFDRVGRQIILTEAGQTLLPQARTILAALEESRQQIANLSEQVSGTLKLATSHHIGLRHLPPILRQYVESYPHVHLDIHFLDSEEGCVAVDQGTRELAVVTLPSPGNTATAQANWDKLSLTPLWQDPLVIIVSHKHALAQQDALTLHSLAAYPAILPEMTTFTRRIIERVFDQQGIELQISLETNYLETIRMLVSVGLGWSILPATMLDNDVQVLNIDFNSNNFQRSLGIVQHQQRTLSNAAKAFVEVLLESSPLAP